MDGDPAASSGAGPGDATPAPLEPRDGWVPGRVAGACPRLGAALGTGLSRAWEVRRAALLVGGVEAAVVLLLLGPLPALPGALAEVGPGVGGPAAGLLSGWWRGGVAGPLATVVAGGGPRVLALLILGSVLDYAVAGGALTLMHAGAGGPVLRRFLAACRAYLPRFLRLLVVAALLSAAVLWVDVRLHRLLEGTAAPPLLPQALAVAALGCVALLFDVARIRAVLTGSRRMLRNLGRSARFLGRNLPRLALLYGVAVAPAVLLATAHALARPRLATSGGPLLPALVICLCVLGRVAVRFLVWGAELSLYRGLVTRELARVAGVDPAAGLVK